MPEPKRPLGPASSDYVPLDPGAFQDAFATLLQVAAGQMPCAPDFPREIYDAPTQRRRPFPDTPFNRGWYTAGLLFDDEADCARFYWRVRKVMPLKEDPKDRKYASDGGLGRHLALVEAVATVPGSERTALKTLRANFNRVFREALAALGPETQVH